MGNQARLEDYTMNRSDILRAIPFAQQHIDRASAAVKAAAAAKAHADTELNFALNNMRRMQATAATLEHEPITAQEENVVSELVEYYLMDGEPA